MVLVSKKDHSLFLVFLYIPVSILKKLLDCFRLHVWKGCFRRVYFMKFWNGYINVRKKAEKKKKREEMGEKTGTRERKKEKY